MVPFNSLGTQYDHKFSQLKFAFTIFGIGKLQMIINGWLDMAERVEIDILRFLLESRHFQCLNQGIFANGLFGNSKWQNLT